MGLGVGGQMEPLIFGPPLTSRLQLKVEASQRS